MERHIIHVDMDAFFASVEQRERPELKGLPVAVGGMPEIRGVVAAASYEARRFGIHSAIPMAAALRLCPELVVVPPRHRLYQQVSKEIMEIFLRFTPILEQISVDEAFLDVTGSLELFGSPENIGRAIQKTVEEEQHLSASVGIGPNKFIAKLASEFKKPHGFTMVAPSQVDSFLAPLPVSALWGVGEKTAEKLKRMGVRLVSDLRCFSQGQLTAAFGKNGSDLYKLCRGQDDRPVETQSMVKSIGREITFSRDLTDLTALKGRLSILSDQVGLRLRRSGKRFRTVTLKIRYADWQTITRSQTLPEATDLSAVIYRTALSVFRNELPLKQPVRLIGVAVSHLEEGGFRQTAFFTSEEKEVKISRVSDEIKEKFGEGILSRGTALYAKDKIK